MPWQGLTFPITNRFLVKGRTQVGTEFSGEPGNLKNLNSRKYSGLTGGAAVGVEAAEDGNGAVLLTTSKKSARSRKPSKSKVVLKKDARRGARVVAKQVESGKRGDLKGDALARYSAIKRSQARK